MEEEGQKSGNKNMIIMIAAVVIIIALVVGGAVVLKMNNKEQATVQAPANSDSAAQPSAAGSTYKDGEYSAQGTYSYHSGTESIGVTLTLKDGVVESVEVEEMAKAPTSKVMQADFAANYKSEVVGKNIDEINLGKISGSSLTPKGFNDALSQIKAQAKS